MSGRLLRAVIAAALVLSALAFAACGSDDEGAEAEAVAVKRPSAKPPEYHQTEYDVSTTWIQDVSDKQVDNYLESVWHDPAVPEYKLRINSRASAGTAPPLASAELARLHASWLPGYKELVFKKTERGQPVIRWNYRLDGALRYEYFFAECGTSIVLRGDGPIGADAFDYFYENVVADVKPVCAE